VSEGAADGLKLMRATAKAARQRGRQVAMVEAQCVLVQMRKTIDARLGASGPLLSGREVRVTLDSAFAAAAKQFDKLGDRVPRERGPSEKG
jgi:hypothetical protein